MGATFQTSPAPASRERRKPRWSPVVIRLEVAADALSLRHLAYLDCARPLSGEVLLAERAGSLVAALSLSDGRVVADPFVSSADVVELLRLRARQLRHTGEIAPG